MNGIQRVKEVIAHVEGVPMARGELVLDSAFAQSFIAWRMHDVRRGNLSPTDVRLECCRALGLDLICLSAHQNHLDASQTHPPRQKIQPFADEGLFVFWVVDGVFQRTARRHGMMALMDMVARAPDAVRAELEHFSNRVAFSMVQGVEAGAHGIILADDIAYTRSTFTAPEFIASHLLPFWKKHVLQARNWKVPIFFHSDGNLNRILPLIQAAGFDGLQGIEAAAGMDIATLNAYFGGSLCLMGGLEPALLAQPNESDNRPETRRTLERAIAALMASTGNQGGFIFGTSSGLHAGMSPERVNLAYRLSFELEAARFVGRER